MQWHSWLRHYATSRNVVGSIPDEVTGFFIWPNPSSRIMTLESTQPLTEMSTRNLPGGKGQLARKADNLTAICPENVGALTSHNPMGLPPRPVTGADLPFSSVTDIPASDTCMDTTRTFHL
jgi:hypothetical protein